MIDLKATEETFCELYQGKERGRGYNGNADEKNM
jgi:hypothetical protein